jgi:enoyl-[acyl-carrier protein] reductase III
MMGTAKAASHHAMTYLAWDLAERGINLNMVCCGSVHTEGVERDLTPEQYDTFITSARDKIPRRRIADPEEVARVVAFLCSPDADLIVGQVLVADGGETLR